MVREEAGGYSRLCGSPLLLHRLLQPPKFPERESSYMRLMTSRIVSGSIFVISITPRQCKVAAFSAHARRARGML